MGIVLTLIAYFLIALLAIPGIIWGVIRAGSFARINNFFYWIAFSMDQTGNVLCQYLFNDLLITNKGHRFGNPDETVSHVLGKNKLQGTLTRLGKMICGILNLLDKNHVENAAKNEQ